VSLRLILSAGSHDNDWQPRKKKAGRAAVLVLPCRFGDFSYESLGGTSRYATGVATFGPSVAPPKIFAKSTPLNSAQSCSTRSSASREATIERTQSASSAETGGKPAPQERAPRNGLPNESLSASPLLDSEPRAQLRMRPTRHDDGRCPTDTAHADANCINSTPLSADHD
jgi:hypothetical protein